MPAFSHNKPDEAFTVGRDAAFTNGLYSIGSLGKRACNEMHPSPLMSLAILGSEMMLEVAFVTLWVMVFYIYILSAIEAKVVSRNTSRTVEAVVETFTLPLEPSVMTSLNEAVQKLEVPDMAAQDKVAKENNDRLDRNSYLAVGPSVALVVLVVASLIYGLHKRVVNQGLFRCPGVTYPDWASIAKGVSMSVTASIVVYMVFSVIVPLNYRSVDSAVVKGTILDTIINFAEG